MVTEGCSPLRAGLQQVIDGGTGRRPEGGDAISSGHAVQFAFARHLCACPRELSVSPPGRWLVRPQTDLRSAAGRPLAAVNREEIGQKCTTLLRSWKIEVP